MKTLLINQIANDRVVIDLDDLSKYLSKNSNRITFQDIVSRTVRDSTYWHLHCLADGSRLERLPEHAKIADFGYPKELFWVQVAEAPIARRATTPEQPRQIRHDGYFALGVKIWTFIEFIGLSWDIFRTRAGKGLWTASVLSVLPAGLSIYMGHYELAIPFILAAPFGFYVRAQLRAIRLMREVWPQVKTRIYR